MDCNDLEELYEMFNTEGHPLLRGHCMSVSDVVLVNGDVPDLIGKIRFYASSDCFEECLYTDEGKFKADIDDARFVGRTIRVDDLKGTHTPIVENGAYFCDAIGFKKIDFDESLTQKSDNLMRVVYVEPNKVPYVTEIEHTLAAEQKAVGGFIEPIYNDDGTTCLIGNEEAKLIGMEGNRRIFDGSQIIAGPFFVCGLTEDDFRSLTDEEVDKYMDMFAEPEQISQDEVQDNIGFTFFEF